MNQGRATTGNDGRRAPLADLLPWAAQMRGRFTRIIRIRRAAGAALLLCLCACRTPPPAPENDCRCRDNVDVRNAGAVVVRWRIEDARVGRLFGRGQCCCAPQDLVPGSPAAEACNMAGQACPETPAWLISQVLLSVRPLGDTVGVGGLRTPCVIPATCSDAELTTDFCLSAGDYELQLLAPRATLDTTGPEARFVFSGGQAQTAPAVRRTLRPGQIVNLDAVLLGVNEPPPAPAL